MGPTTEYDDVCFGKPSKNERETVLHAVEQARLAGLLENQPNIPSVISYTR